MSGMLSRQLDANTALKPQHNSVDMTDSELHVI